MKLAQFVQVNTSYTRSINIERDLEGQSTNRPYIPTSRALYTLGSIVTTLHGQSASRAWALVGPYGSGKSAFGLFLTKLLGSAEKNSCMPSQSILDGANAKLGEQFSEHLKDSRGYCAITITGSPEPLTKRLAVAMLASAEKFLAGRRGVVPAFVHQLRDVVNQQEVPIGNLVEWLGELQKSVNKAGGRGVLIVIDELGKFLEYEARHRQSTDVYLLQALAEHAGAENEAPLLLVVLLHQAFEQYFTTLGDQLKNEWKKVQGRFESIPFLESAEQVLRVVRAAISQNLPENLQASVVKESHKIAKALKAANALPPGLDSDVAASIFIGSYPLHPLSLLVLPSLCQKVAQNERTLFSYLGSAETYGFQEALSRLDTNSVHPEWVMPWEIYEYFILNQPGLVTDHITHRRWAEVVTAVDRLGDAADDVVNLLKTIGLLNITGAQGGLKASDELLRLCYVDELVEDGQGFNLSLKQLVDHSIVTFRRFNSEYRVWQGSDFDLESALQEQRDQLGHVELAKLLNERSDISPVIARRHSIETGTLRYFKPVFVDTPNQLSVDLFEQSTLLFCLAESREVEDAFFAELRNLRVYPQVVGAVISNAVMLRRAITEVIAFERVQRNYSDVSNDPIASRELKDRMSQAVNQEQDFLLAILEEPESSTWWWSGLDHRIASKREMQELLSNVLDTVYSHSPRIYNELINRDKPSSTANGARKKLLMAMLEHDDKEDLGFEKFPAEKAMYRALLFSTGIHACVDGVWRFQPPIKINDKAKLAHTWQAIEDFLDDTEQLPQSIGKLFDILGRAPYGLKKGPLPILLVAIYQAYRDEIAIYKDGHFIPFMTQEIIERILKEPAVFSIQRFKMDQVRESLYKTYIEAINISGELPQNPNLLAAAKPLARFMMGLPDYTKQTKRLSPEAQLIRERFFASKSPLQLLFFQIPEALGCRPLVAVDITTDQLNIFRTRLFSVMAELRVAYHGLLHEFDGKLRAAFKINQGALLDEMRARLKWQYSNLRDYTIDVQGLKAFIGRLTDPFGDESQWLISLASFLARKPPEKWNDEDAATVEYRLVEFTKRLFDLESLRFYNERRSDNSTDLELVLLKSISQTRGESEFIVALDPYKRKALEGAKAQILEILSQLSSQELSTAALALILEELSPKNASEEYYAGVKDTGGVHNG